MPIVVPTGRDLRLDLFRGLALWLIFVDHIPSNIVNWITIRNYGFSDAAEIFVFISGYTAAFVYGRTMEQRGVVVASARILKRAWTVYVAHVFIFVIFMAEIAYLTRSFDNPLYNEEMGVFDFLNQPGDTLIQALLLKFKPVFMDVLPLYIVLLLAFPPVLWLLLHWPTAALAISVALHTASWNLSDLLIVGHAIECRINAENPETFAPSPGMITAFNLPGGPGVRVDTYVYSGYRVPSFYDSMIAKVIVHARTRDLAIARMKRALEAMVIEGIKTTIPLHLKIMDDPKFKAGDISTSFMEYFLAKNSRRNGGEAAAAA